MNFRLSDLSTKQPARILHIHQFDTALDENGQDVIAERLKKLGFIQGEEVQIVAKGLFGGEPILVKLGVSRFALRKNEAERIEVQLI